MVVYRLCAGNNNSAVMRAFGADRKVVPGGQGHGSEYDTVVAEDGIGTCDFEVGNEQCHHGGLD